MKDIKLKNFDRKDLKEVFKLSMSWDYFKNEKNKSNQPMPSSKVSLVLRGTTFIIHETDTQIIMEKE